MASSPSVAELVVADLSHGYHATPRRLEAGMLRAI